MDFPKTALTTRPGRGFPLGWALSLGESPANRGFSPVEDAVLEQNGLAN
jgi:hypothetical protein